MTTWSTEELVDVAVETLSASLGPALAAVYAARADADQAAGRTIEYEVPRPGLFEIGGDYYVPASATILRYPAIEVALPDLNIANFDIGQVEGDATENLIVLAWERSAQMPVLYRKLTRLLAAIYDVLIAPTSLGSAEVQTVRGAWRWNPEAKEADQIVSGALLVLGLESTRTRP